MCGIYGYFSTVNESDIDMRLSRASHLLNHRGPDSSGQEFYSLKASSLFLGHTRLSIIDLTNRGHQPMRSNNKRFTITFNGEIYNYKELRQQLKVLGYFFNTDTDTEVLLACWEHWGIECLTRFNGMFAFVIFDRDSNTLTLVRDAFGIKPLFYSLHKDKFIFASEIPALISLLPKKPKHNIKTAYDYLVNGKYDNSFNTFFEEIDQIQPGHFLTINLNFLSCSNSIRWWFPKIEERTNLTFNEASDQLREKFLNNVRLQLRSDVPLGATLSGGIDSSAIVCAMRYLEPGMPINTFSYVARGTNVNEEKWVDLINKKVGAVVHKVTVSPSELSLDLDDMIKAQGEPFGGTSIYAQYRVFKMAKDNGITVTLDGQGADELLAGYSGYPVSRIKSLIDRGEYFDLFRFILAWSQWPGRSTAQGIRMGLSELLPKNFVEKIRNLRKPYVPEWININKIDSNLIRASELRESHLLNSEKGRQLVNDLRHALCVDGLAALLRHGDRNSMRWSVESRVPFLTIDFAEYCLSLPEKYLISNNGQSKNIFRSAMRGIVPDIVLDRKDKIGFSTPEKDWLRDLSINTIKDIDSVDGLTFLNLSKAKLSIESMISGEKPFSSEAWRLINYCRWSKFA